MIEVADVALAGLGSPECVLRAPKSNVFKIIAPSLITKSVTVLVDPMNDTNADVVATLKCEEETSWW
jgi:hypothetical protein